MMSILKSRDGNWLMNLRCGELISKTRKVERLENRSMPTSFRSADFSKIDRNLLRKASFWEAIPSLPMLLIEEKPRV